MARDEGPSQRLASGTQVGIYRVDTLIGRGGMGEVYRRTTRSSGVTSRSRSYLLAGSATADRARFDREARALATLNHPHVAAIYGLANSEDVHGLVLELVDGETLEDRLTRSRGGLPLGDLVPIARQIALGLESAHENGIVHRDLKPANIKITEAGVVKVLDFGVAKLRGDAIATADDGRAMTVSGTLDGTIVGTVAYMSPEQARGKPVDKRADVWAFGCILYEMLTGRRTFRGETVSDTIAATLDRSPDWSLLPATTPPSLRRLLSRCLEKDPTHRLRDIGDALFDLDESLRESRAAAAPVPAASRAGHRRILALALGALVVAVAAAIGWSFRSPTDTPAPAAPVALTSLRGNEEWPSFSPDGRQVAFVWNGLNRDNHDIYVRIVGSSADPLRLTRDAADDSSPSWSPDGTQIAFVRRGSDRAMIYSVSPIGGSERKVAEFPTGRGSKPSWSRDSKSLVISSQYRGDHARFGRWGLAASHDRLGDPGRTNRVARSLPGRRLARVQLVSGRTGMHARRSAARRHLDPDRIAAVGRDGRSGYLPIDMGHRRTVADLRPEPGFDPPQSFVSLARAGPRRHVTRAAGRRRERVDSGGLRPTSRIRPASGRSGYLAARGRKRPRDTPLLLQLRGLRAIDFVGRQASRVRDGSRWRHERDLGVEYRWDGPAAPGARRQPARESGIAAMVSGRQAHRVRRVRERWGPSRVRRRCGGWPCPATGFRKPAWRAPGLVRRWQVDLLQLVSGRRSTDPSHSGCRRPFRAGDPEGWFGAGGLAR